MLPASQVLLPVPRAATRPGPRAPVHGPHTHLVCPTMDGCWLSRFPASCRCGRHACERPRLCLLSGGGTHTWVRRGLSSGCAHTRCAHTRCAHTRCVGPGPVIWKVRVPTASRQWSANSALRLPAPCTSRPKFFLVLPSTDGCVGRSHPAHRASAGGSFCACLFPSLSGTHPATEPLGHNRSLNLVRHVRTFSGGRVGVLCALGAARESQMLRILVAVGTPAPPHSST